MSLFEPPVDMTPPSIPRRTAAEREADPVSFVALRQLGVSLNQHLSGAVWTDYNLHDPGVTILEQLCYALSELAFQADLPTADHLARLDGSIQFRQQALFRPDDILRCRATTEADYRRVLLDRVAGLADARLRPCEDTPGLLRLSLRMADHHARAADEAPPEEAARQVYRGVRTVGEDLDEAVTLVQPTFVTISLQASISGMREPADILAEIYRKCAEEIAGVAHAHSLVELVRRPDMRLDEVLEGPRTETGIILPGDLPRSQRDGLVLSRLRHIVRSVEGVEEVVKLRVDPAALPPGSAPCLRVPGDGDHEQDVALVRQVTLLRRGIRAVIDPRAVASRHTHDFHPRLAAGATHEEFDRVVRLPSGRHRRPEPFRSVQEDFPVIYGLGRRGAGGGGPAAVGRVAQLQGYLALFDQLLANTAAQLDHMKDLFNPDQAQSRSFWRHILGDADVPGIEASQVDRATLGRDVYAAFDAAADRRSRALDHMLALYGESNSQNTLRQFLDHLDSRELSRALLENKAEYLRRTLLLGRDRGAGFNTGGDLWKSGEKATTGLQARIALLLGFRIWRARSLTQRISGPPNRPPARRRRAVGRMRAVAPTVALPPPHHDRTRALSWPAEPLADRGHGSKVLKSLPHDPGLHADLIAHAVNRERFRWLPDEGDGAGGRLLLTDPHDNWRELHAFASEAEAGAFATRLRRRLLALNDACDGLHIVEHILLRRRATGAAPDPDFHALRATFVFPDWTARTSRAAFRRFAAETVAINCPAHVLAQCLWLDFGQMKRFEALFIAWMARLKAHATAPDAEARTVTGPLLDTESAMLEAFLREALGHQLLAASVEAP